MRPGLLDHPRARRDAPLAGDDNVGMVRPSQKQNAPGPVGSEAHVSTLTNRHTFCLSLVKRGFLFDLRSFFANRVRSSSFTPSAPCIIARESGRPSTPWPRGCGTPHRHGECGGYWITRLRGTPSRVARRGPLAGNDTAGQARKTKRPGAGRLRGAIRNV